MADSERTPIWFLIGSLQVGGANKTLVDLANNLDHDRFDVTIWTILPDNPLAEDLRPEVSHRSLRARGKWDLAAPIRFARALRRARPAILQAFAFYDNTLARLAATVSPGTRVISGVRVVPTEPRRLRATVDRATMGLTDMVVSNSEAGRRLAIDRGASPDRVHVVHNGRELEEYRLATAPDGLRDALSIPTDARVVGTVGRLLERKGHFDLLEAWPAVRADNPDAHLLFVGPGPERGRLEAKAADLGVASSVTFAGVRDDVPELLDLMDVFAFPSHFEGLPGALIEAMAAGLPIVATDAPGVDEVVADGETALVVPPQSPEQLSAAIRDLLTDEELARSLGERASDDAEARFSVETMVSKFTALYDELATG